MTHKAAAKFTVARHSLRDRLNDNFGERGASALEYVGMVIVAAMLVGFVISAIETTDVKGTVKTAVNDILDKGGEKK